MARKRRRRPARRHKSGGQPWVFALAGLLAGLVIAALVYFLWIARAPVDIGNTPAPALESEKTGKTTSQARPRAPVRDARKTTPKAPSRPRFDFYDLLPEMEVVVPEAEIRGKPTREGVKRVEQPGTYLLQAGSFPSHQRADQLRARLALLGLETRIQTVSVDGNRTWHRVRVGPFDNLTELNEARRLLRQHGIDAILIRLKRR
ncbi:MAG TPA: SPOR domain-containing protein [Gammaproteobacteria bacterium]|nr:SPOR domain-containing protein [Gammaproteobacteria bacterium]